MFLFENKISSQTTTLINMFYMIDVGIYSSQYSSQYA